MKRYNWCHSTIMNVVKYAKDISWQSIEWNCQPLKADYSTADVECTSVFDSR